jgi:nitroreductase
MPELTPDELLTTTRAVRRRLDFERPVPRALLEECLEIALQAPTGSNLTLWRWLLVDDRERVREAARIYGQAIRDQMAAPDSAFSRAAEVPGHGRLMESARHLAANLHRSPVLAFPLLEGRVEGASAFVAASLWGSILPAVWSFLLALRARGLGSAWTTVHLLREEQMAALLGIPAERYTQVGLFPVAFTRGTRFRRAQRPPVAEILDWNAFGAERS